MTIKYSIPTTLLFVGTLSVNALADDSITNRSNELRNELAVGYQFGFNDTYNVAFEVFGQKSPTETTRIMHSSYGIDEPTPVDNNEIWGLDDNRADLDWATGVLLRPGYNITNTTRLFLEGGVVWGDFSMELTDSSNGVGAAQLSNADLVQNDTLRGLRYGAGIEHHLKSINNLSLVLDYSMTEFESSSSTMPNGMAVATADDFDSADALNAPAYQQVMFSVKAEFDPGFRF
jgi:opacity protein-like surface antigen